MINAKVRIGRVRFRSGADLRLLHCEKSEDRAITEQRIRACLDRFAQLGLEPSGFAFVAWSADLWSIWSARCGPNSPIPDLLVPQFVRERLRSGMTADLAISQVNEAWGNPTAPAG